MKTLTSIVLVSGLFTAASAMAQPAITTSCPIARKIKVPANSNGFYLSRDCKTVYVLPPEKGNLTLEGVTESALIQRCGELDVALKNLKTITARLTEARAQETETVPEETDSFDPSRPLSSYFPDNSRVSTPALSEDELIVLLKERQKEAERIVTNFGGITGLYANLLYTTGYGDHLAKYRELNAALNLNIMQVPLKNTKFSFSTPLFREGESSVIMNSSFPASEEGSMNGSVSGMVELSLLGACKLRDYAGKIPRRLSSYKFSAALPARLSYEYDLQTTIKYTAEYHRGGLAEQIRKVSTKGGFFTSSSLSKMITTTKTDGWFRYKSECDESRACKELEDINVIEIKKRLMDEVISNIALVKHQTILLPEGAPGPGRNGASVASSELKKCYHIYCQIGAAVLDIANATFGGTSKVDQYINKESHWETETQETRKAFSYVGTMGFAPKEK
ncbi:MAG: hypothetical protein V4598_07990 [Bdellovibrionota bacterium]